MIDPPNEIDIKKGHVLDSVGVTGLKLRRARVVLDKLFEHPRVKISSFDTIMLDGVDTNLSLGNFLYSLQFSANPDPKYKEIARILNLDTHHVHKGKWITIN